MRERHGSVRHEDRLVGRLRADTRGAIHFRYAPEWIEDGFPISLRLPLDLGTQETNAHGFFQGLLPEGRSRQRICRRLRIEPDDDAGLLLAIGEDCAGALSILPEGAGPGSGNEPPRAVDDDELRGLVTSHGARLGAGTRVRFSLAGAQEKIPVIRDGGRLAHPDRDHPSSHILKFETIPHVCIAEHATLELARAMGLDVVACELHVLDDDERTPYLLVERYDRYADDRGIRRRLHQEDLIQALGYETDVKYEHDGGPELSQVVRLVRDHTAEPIAAARRVLDWQIFNYLAGNSDGHGKNLALLYPRGRTLPRVAPFYDLIAIEYLNDVADADYDRRLAFFVGGEATPERIGRATWERFASDVGFRPRYVLGRVREMAERIADEAEAVRRTFAERFGERPVQERFVRSIYRRAHWTLSVVGD